MDVSNNARVTNPRGRAAATFAALVARLHGLLPGPLRRIPTTFVGFTLINGFTFAVDLTLLWLTHGLLHVAYPVAVTVSFGLASILAFVLNKLLNFRAHGNTAVQSTRYLVVIVSNYLLWILGFSSLLEWLGVQYQVARVLAACCEGIYIYALVRWWVFRPRPGPIAARRVLMPAEDANR